METTIINNDLSTKERVIAYLLQRPRRGNEVTVPLAAEQEIGCSGQEIVNVLIELEDTKYIEIKSASPHKNHNAPTRVHLLPSCIHYFEDQNQEMLRIKQLEQQENELHRDGWVQFWINILFTAATLAVAIIALVRGL